MKDLLCSMCGQNQSQWLIFWEKIQPETTLSVWHDPGIYCDDCKVELLPENTRFEERPVVYNFENLYKETTIGWLLSKRGKESNHLRNPYWRKKLWRICKIQQYYKGKKEIEEIRADEEGHFS